MDFIDYNNPSIRKQTRIVQRQNQPCVTAVTDGSRLGYKYFEGTGVRGILLELKGAFKGNVLVSRDEEGKDILGEKAVAIDSRDWQVIQIACDVSLECSPVYFGFAGEGACEIKSFGFLN